MVVLQIHDMVTYFQHKVTKVYTASFNMHELVFITFSMQYIMTEQKKFSLTITLSIIPARSR